jgi:[acyl-carrier-protein] S-malonyltransferase
MLAVLKGAPEQAAALAARFGVIVANDNAPGQVVLAGPEVALDQIAAAARADGLRAIRLDVAGAFHTPAMTSAASAFTAALHEVAVAEPRVPVYSSASAAPFRDVRGELARGVIRPVRWRETMLALAARGAQRFVDVGPGGVLAKLVGRNLPDAEAVAAQEVLGVGA